MSLSPDNVTDVLAFWFEQSGRDKWFKTSDDFDAQVRSRFEMLAIMLAGARSLSPKSGDECLAMILCLDQFPRNMYRGTPAAFAWDDKALACADIMIERGWDLKLEQDPRSFVYMPYMHAEDLAAQERCVDLTDRRLDNENQLFHAKAHMKLIEKFGRFPHRNEILGRVSTPSEIRFLADGGYKP